MRILLYGSTVLSAVVAKEICKHHEVIGYVPSVNPTLPGEMPAGLDVLKAPSKADFDVALSLQYDRILPVDGKTFNLHTGLLPRWGGNAILYHTLKEGAREQGLTFHRIDKDFDRGDLVATISYPVLHGDDAIDLYRRMLLLAPGFVLGCLGILENTGIDAPFQKLPPPTFYAKNSVAPEDREAFAKVGAQMRHVFGGQNG